MTLEVLVKTCFDDLASANVLVELAIDLNHALRQGASPPVAPARAEQTKNEATAARIGWATSSLTRRASRKLSSWIPNPVATPGRTPAMAPRAPR